MMVKYEIASRTKLYQGNTLLFTKYGKDRNLSERLLLRDNRKHGKGVNGYGHVIYPLHKVRKKENLLMMI